MNDTPSESEQRTQLAADRTDWAEDRTLLANERTFAGWMRTGLASAALGLGFHAVFQKVEPTWLAKLVATFFVLVAITIFIIAFGKVRRVARRMTSHAVEPVGTSAIAWIAGLLIAAACALAIVLWVV